MKIIGILILIKIAWRINADNLQGSVGIQETNSHKSVSTITTVTDSNMNSNQDTSFSSSISPSNAVNQVSAAIAAILETKTKKITILETAHERCSVSNCPIVRGTCNRNNLCDCVDGFISVIDDDYPFYCNYELKKQLTAFILEFFIGFGTGHLYIGNATLAMKKLVIYFTIYFILCFMPYFSGQTRSNFLTKIVPYLHTVSIITLVLWQLADGILFGINYYPDGNGIPLQKWSN